MSAEVHALPGITKPECSLDKQPQPKIVDYLERLLGDAKLGHIQSIAIVTVRGNRHVRHGWECGDLQRNNGHCLIAGVAYLQHELAATALATATESVEIDSPDDAA